MSEATTANGTEPGLWRNGAFVRLWFAQVVSNAGTAITGLALPLTAVMLLGANSGQMSLLRIANFIPPMLFSFIAGVWVDRARRQPILVWSDLGRAVLLAAIPLAALFGLVTFPLLWTVAFVVSTLSAFSSLASLAILPAIVPKSRLVEANSKLAVTDAVLAIAAPGVAGGLVQVVGAPKAILADAASYVASALTLRRLRANEVVPERSRQRGATWREIGAGMQELVRTPILRALTLSVTVGTFGTAMQSTVSLLFVVNELGFSPALLGAIGACAGGGALVGSAFAARATDRLGVGPAIIFGNLIWALGSLIGAFAPHSLAVAVVLVGAGAAFANLGGALWGVAQMSLRQAITPIGLFARATAARRLPMFGMQIAGAALGGVLGTAIGYRPTLLIGAAGLFLGTLLLYWSPIRRTRDLASAG